MLWDINESCKSYISAIKKKVSLNSVSQFQRRVTKMSQPIRSRGGFLVFVIGPENTSLIKDIEILLPVKFR